MEIIIGEFKIDAKNVFPVKKFKLSNLFCFVLKTFRQKKVNHYNAALYFNNWCIYVSQALINLKLHSSEKPDVLE